MNEKKKAVLILFLIFVTLVFCSLASAEENISINEQAKLCINDSKNIMLEMEKDGFSIQKINDSLINAEGIYNAQVVLLNDNRAYDFAPVFPYCDTIKKTREEAYRSRDELNAFNKFYSDLDIGELNVSEIEIILDSIDLEMRDERYEKSRELISNAYGRAIELKASATALNLFYKTTTRGIKTFFAENWKYIAVIVVFIILFYIIFRKKIYVWFVMRKIDRLEFRKKVLKNLIKKTQREYFNEGKMSEGVFNIKTRKFAELIRDIERQVPLLQESIALVSKKIKRKEKKRRR